MAGNQDAQRLNNEGAALHGQGRLADALRLYEQALVLAPDFIEARANTALALYSLGRAAEALAVCDALIARAPDSIDLHLMRGNVLKALGQFPEALAAYDCALSLAPARPEPHGNRGSVLLDLRRPADALIALDHALTLDPGFVDALYNSGIALLALGRYAEAVARYDAVLARRPDHAQALNNRGMSLQRLGRYEDALASYDRAVALAPDDAEAQWNRALLLLLRGDFARGWPLYEWRRRQSRARELDRSNLAPLWIGDQPLTGRTILLHAEQGLGDAIQFCRYATLVAAQGAQVTIEAPVAVAGLLATLDPAIQPAIQVVMRGNALGAFDFQCPLMSLPLAFKTTLDTIPARRSYLRTAPDKTAIWSARLWPPARLRVGLAWAGAPGHSNDRNRSLPAALLQPLSACGAQFHCLQIEVLNADRQTLAGMVAFHDADLGDFTDTAALMANLDLVIAVDTAIAHAAAALGQTTWILLPFSPDYRWLLARSDSPWYPTARLFRQPAPGDWPTVIADVARELADLASTTAR